jgi:hypothetical protein
MINLKKISLIYIYMSHRIKNATIEDGFVRNPDRVYYEENFEHLPLSTGEFALTGTGSTDFRVFQPANTIIDDAFIVCITAPTITSGNVGISIDSSAHEAVAGAADILVGTATNIIANSTTIAVNTLKTVDITGATTLRHTAANRSLFIRVTTSTALSVAGNFRLVINYKKLSSAIYQGASFLSLHGTNGHQASYDGANGYSGCKLTTTAAANDQAIIFGKNDINTPISNGVIRTDSNVEFETSIIIPTLTTLGVMAGLRLTVPTTLNTTVSTDNNKAMFIFGATAALHSGLSSNANLLFVHSIAGTHYITDLGLPIVANQEYNLKIKINKHRKVSIYVNGIQYGLTSTGGTTGTTATNSYDESAALADAISLYPVVGVQVSAAAARDLVVNYVKLSRDVKKA